MPGCTFKRLLNRLDTLRQIVPYNISTIFILDVLFGFELCIHPAVNSVVQVPFVGLIIKWTNKCRIRIIEFCNEMHRSPVAYFELYKVLLCLFINDFLAEESTNCVRKHKILAFVA